MADDKKKGLALVLSMGGKPKKDEGEDLMGSERASAGKALAAALKSGDGAEIAEAFKVLMDAVSEPEAEKAKEPEEEEV